MQNRSVGGKVADLLEGKGRPLYRIDGEASVLDGVRAMVEANVGALLVTEDDRITGIVTERDYMRRVTLEGRDERETPVREIMTSPLIVVTPETTIDECRALMTDRRIRHLPVVEDGDVVGMVSIGDVVKYTSEQQSFELRYLHEYINTR
jgi:CBS domain-containing protein